MALNSPFDWQQIFVTDFAGSPEIFSFIALVIVGWVMGRFGFNNTEASILFVLFAVIMATYMGALYVLVILLVGFVVYYQVSKFAR